MRRSALLFALLFIACFVIPTAVFAQMSSTNYQIFWDTTSEGGDEGGASTNYQVRDTIGGTGVGTGSSASYSLSAGYRLADSSPLTFTMRMASPAFTPITYSAFSASGKSVTAASAADLGTLAVGDVIAARQGSGFSRDVVVGKILSISGATVYVDTWAGAVADMTASPGASDAASLIKLGTTSVALGTVGASSAAVATGYIGVESNAVNGYIVYVQAAAPSNGTHALTPVSDGAVTIGSEEYGLRTLGSQASLASDTGFSGDVAVQIQASDSASGHPQDRSVLLYKLAVSSSTPAGSYGQSVFFTLTPRY